MRFRTFVLCLPLALAACNDAKLEQDTPQRLKDQRRMDRGSLTGEGGLLSLGGPKDADAAQSGAALGVNSFLWRATLDTLGFLPITAADPFGGTVITDWYEDPKAPGERYKVNALIMDRVLRADGIKISVFKQKIEKGVWRDQPLDESLSRRLEDTILTRARELRITQLGR